MSNYSFFTKVPLHLSPDLIIYILPMCNNEYSYESCQGGYKRNYIIPFFPFSCLMRFSSNWPHRDKSSLVEACYSICQDWFNSSSWEAAASSLSSACSLTHCRKVGPYPVPETTEISFHISHVENGTISIDQYWVKYSTLES